MTLGWRVTAGFLFTSALLLAFQASRRPVPRSLLEYDMERPTADPEDAREKAEYTFIRTRYRTSPVWGDYPFWGMDANRAERQFVRGVRRLTRIQTRSVEEIVDLGSEELHNWPWIYAVEVGRWDVSPEEAKRMREYFDRGGFLMVDDFHGSLQWAIFMRGLERIFPDRAPVDLPPDHPIFHVIYDNDDKFQVPGIQYFRTRKVYEEDGVEPRWRAILDDKGRVQVAICHNMDLGDAWEWADEPEYPEKWASMAYRLGINYLVYSMTH